MLRKFLSVPAGLTPTPPSPTYDDQFFAGWVPVEREADLDGWIAFLNNEIAKRLGLPHVEDMSFSNDHKAPP